MDKNGVMKGDDLRQTDLPQLDWSNADTALTAAYDYAIAQSKDAENWYVRKRRPKRIGGRILRVSAIVLAAIAALIPILAEIYTHGGKPGISPGWASVALVLAAALVGLDRYFGLSTGWTRFMTTQLAIAKLRHDFEFEWQRAQAPGRDPQPDQLLQLIHRFISAIDQTVAAETGTWSSEFQAGLEATLRDLSQPQGRT